MIISLSHLELRCLYKHGYGYTQINGYDNMITQTFLTWFQSQMNVWVLVGMCGQGLFFTRFMYQWLASERAKKSVMPEAFWYFSLAGGIIVLAYSIHKQDIVFILGQG